MSVTTSNYTSTGNTVIVQVSQETTSTTLINAVTTFLTGTGWTLYDTVNASVLANPFTPIETRVYRALNADGVTYKYFIIRWDTLKLFFYTSCCESWNATTHVATNESWTQAGGFAQGYDLGNSYLILSARARHVMIWPFINSQPGLWTAVMEFERVAQEDLNSINTTPYPCFAWTNSVMLGTPWGLTNILGTPSNAMFAFPRLPDGTVGQPAANYMVPVTNRGMMPPSYPQTAITITNDPNYGHLGSYYKNLVYNWNTSTGAQLIRPSSPISVDHRSNIQAYGRSYNFGISGIAAGAAGATIYANVDVKGGWPSGNINSAATTTTECLLLPLNGGNEGNAQLTASQYSQGIYSYITANIATNTTTANVPSKVLGIGDTLWIAANDGIRTASITAGQNNFGVLRVPNINGVTDIAYDGQRTIYGATANGIVKIDTVNYNIAYATSANTLANGCGYLSLDAKNVYASNRNANTAPSCVVLDRSTFTLGLGNVFVHPGSVLLGVASSYGTPVPNYAGNVYITTTPGTAASATTYIAQFTANTGSGLTVINPTRGVAVAFGGDTIWNDPISTRVFLISSTPSTNSYTVQELWAANLVAAGTGVAIPTNLTVSSTTSQTNLMMGTTADNRGDAYILPIRGLHYLGIKKPGIAGTATAVPGVFFQLISPAVSNTTLTPVVAVAYNNSAVTGGVPVSPFQNSGCLTTNTSQLFGSYWIQNATNVAYVINGIYSTTRTDGGITSRLLLKS